MIFDILAEVVEHGLSVSLFCDSTWPAAEYLYGTRSENGSINLRIITQ